jgi:serine acetyltransferase
MGLLRKVRRVFSLGFRAWIVLLPWFLRRRVLSLAFGYQLHPTSHIGRSWIFPEQLIMEGDARIEHFTVCRGIARLEMGPHSLISNFNWISGEPRETRAGLYERFPDRYPELVLEEHATIVKRHYIDCTDSVRIGEYAVLSGIRTTLLSHAYDIERGSQMAAPVRIGKYAMVSGNCTILPGSELPAYSVLGAASLLNKPFEQTHRLYGGVPAKEIKELPSEAGYFTRAVGELT